MSTLVPPCGRRDGIECESCKELTGIEAQLEELHERHRQALVKKNYVHSPLIHQFPLEINTYIFLLAFPPQETCPWCSPCEQASPLVLTKVCHTWRVLALSIPRLWSGISVDTEKPNFPLLNHQIAHSGVVPLTVHFISGFGSGFGLQQELADAKQVMSLVVKQLHRIVSFCLFLSNDVAMACGSISDFDYPKTAPLLEELHFHCLDGPSSSFQLRLAIEPPRPRQVFLNYISFDQICLDWSNVSSLTLNFCRVHILPPTLKSLKHLVLEYTEWDFPSEQPPVVNRSIEYVYMLEKSDLADFMLTMTLPSLRTLDVDISDTQSLDIVCDFLRRSICPLQALHVWYANAYDSDANRVIQGLLEVLEITKMLQHLTIQLLGVSFIDFPSLSFEPLVRQFSSQNRGFLPHLQTLTLETPSIPPIDLLLDAMTLNASPSESPSGPERPLHTLNLELTIPFDEVGPIRQDVLVRILQMRMAGKKISITQSRNDLVEHWKSSCGSGETLLIS